MRAHHQKPKIEPGGPLWWRKRSAFVVPTSMIRNHPTSVTVRSDAVMTTTDGRPVMTASSDLVVDPVTGVLHSRPALAAAAASSSAPHSTLPPSTAILTSIISQQFTVRSSRASALARGAFGRAHECAR